MKIQYIANVRFPTERAHGAQIAKMCEAFADAGATVTLVIPNRAATIAEDPYRYYGVKSNFTIVRLGGMQNPQSRIGYWLAYMRFVVQLPGYCRAHAADIYYTRDESIAFVLSFFGIKAVWEAHGWKSGMFVRRILKMMPKIVAITQLAKDRFLHDGVLTENILVAPDGVDETMLTSSISMSNSRARFGLPENGKFAFYIGSLNEWKGFRTLLCCSEALAARGITVVIVGSATEAQKQEFPRAMFLGFIPYKDLAAIQSAADILVIPNSAKSIVSTEYTSPLKLFAHMASGRPIVSSDIPSLREILDEDTAYFFTPDDPDSLCRTIDRVTSDPDAAREKADKALEKVRDYTWAKRARTILDFIDP